MPNTSSLIEFMTRARKGVNFIIFNPAAFTHTSIAFKRCLARRQNPLYRGSSVNVHRRESFRQTSYFSDIAEGVICGLGNQSYELALNAAIGILAE